MKRSSGIKKHIIYVAPLPPTILKRGMDLSDLITSDLRAVGIFRSVAPLPPTIFKAWDGLVGPDNQRSSDKELPLCHLLI